MSSNIFCRLVTFTCLLWLTACTDKVYEPVNEISESRSRSVADQVAIESEVMVSPLSCLGSLGLDLMAPHASAGPHFATSVQENRSSYLAWSYFSGDFQDDYRSARNSTIDQYRDVIEPYSAEYIYGYVLPLAYAAMCFKDIETIDWARSKIKNASERSTDVFADRVNSQRYKLVYFELGLARAKINESYSELLDLKEELRVFRAYHIGKDERLFILPSSKKSLAAQAVDREFMDSKDKARFDLLSADLSIMLAIKNDDPELLIQAIETYREINENKDSRAKNYIKVVSSHSSKYETGYFLKATAHYKWLDAIRLIMNDEELLASYPTPPKGIDFSDPVQVKKLNDYIKVDPGIAGVHFENLSRTYSQELSFESSPFLWALHHNIHYQLHVNLQSAPPTRRMVGGRKSLPHQNGEGSCHAYLAFHNAQLVIPTLESEVEIEKWCTKAPK